MEKTMLNAKRQNMPKDRVFLRYNLISSDFGLKNVYEKSYLIMSRRGDFAKFSSAHHD
jgi:hypothetical protein